MSLTELKASAGKPGELMVKQALVTSIDDLRQLFRPEIKTSRDAEGKIEQGAEIRNPHVESPVSDSVRREAVPSAVMVLITDEPEPKVVLTKRQQGIRFAGHLCFPGGRGDSGETARQTALRECREEMGVRPEDVELLGGYGFYISQAGFRIEPFVGLIEPGYPFTPAPAEVSAIYTPSLAQVLDPKAYSLTRMGMSRAYFGFEMEDARVGGPTVSLMIGLLEWIAHRQGR